MRIDLHSHSSVSDGTDTPAALLATARDAGLDVVALTDHDTTDGWAPAAAGWIHGPSRWIPSGVAPAQSPASIDDAHPITRSRSSRSGHATLVGRNPVVP